MVLASTQMKATPEAANTAVIAAVCKAASDPLRVQILRVLCRESFGVQELAKILGIPQPGMSHHLKILAKNGLLVTRRQGNSIFYRRAMLNTEDSMDAFLGSMFATVDAITLSDEISHRMNLVYEERSEQSREFFARNADKFSEHQGLLCDLSQYSGNIKELLDLTRLSKDSKVMEVGPGQGRLLDELATRFDHLVALDLSGEMLALAQGKTNTLNRRIEFVNDSLETFQLGKQKSFDAVVLNMVLHHMASPQRAMHKLAEILRPSGFVIIADLCLHNQDWTQASCGDVWLGFDPKDLSDWAASAGLQEIQSLYLGLKNGFQIQLKLFRKC